AGKVRGMAREFQASIDEAVRDTELEEVKNQIESVGKVDVTKVLTDAVDPTGEIDKGMGFTRFGDPLKSQQSQPDSTKADDREAAETVTRAGGEKSATDKPDDAPPPASIPKKTAADA
ncbi:MAG: hypothetical protein QF827_04195, partial [Alphaproteobacteria bacterium]|nr:hypothetical protein [Alphaproteobacteria bacterium]